MFFLIRCIFWLSVVFSTIFGSNPEPRPHMGAVPAQVARVQPAVSSVHHSSAEQMGKVGQAWVSALLENVWTKASGTCGGAKDCAAIAARLTQFAQEHPFKTTAQPENSEQFGGDRGRLIEAAARRAPLPPVRPRHFGT